MHKTPRLLHKTTLLNGLKPSIEINALGNNKKEEVTVTVETKKK